VHWLTRAHRRARSRLAPAEREDVRATFSGGPDLRPPEGTTGPGAASTVDDGIPRGMRVAGAWAWRIVLLVAAGYLLLRLIGALRVVVIPVVVALLLAALFEPAAAMLRRHGVHRSLAAAVVLIGGLAVVGGSLGLIVRTFVAQFDDLSVQVGQGLDEVKGWLSAGPLHFTQADIDGSLQRLQQQLATNQSTLTSGALSTVGTMTEVVAGFFVVLFTLFFFLRDGGPIWQFLCGLLPRPARVPVTRAGEYSWHTLVSYVRATVLVAFVDAVGIGVGLAVLRVPLALPLGALVFLGAFIPVVGATLSGAVAILVALVTHGPLSALIVLGIVIAVQQLEGHILQPLIMGRAVALHPLAVILAITTGVVTAGIIGGLVAVPLLAVLNTAVRYLAAHPAGEPTPDRAPPGTEPTDPHTADAEREASELGERRGPDAPPATGTSTDLDAGPTAGDPEAGAPQPSPVRTVAG
jgi:predicted PurR-regulated permease PerM